MLTPLLRPSHALFQVALAGFAAAACLSNDCFAQETGSAPAKESPTAGQTESSQGSKPVEPPAAMTTIGKEELMGHANFLASDELGGRLTGTPGQHAAAKYIAEHFAKLGLTPWGDPKDGDRDERGFLQHYEIKRTYITEGSALQFGKTTLTEGYAVIGQKPGEVAVAGEVRWCGFGRTRGLSADVEGDLDGAIAVVAVKRPRGRVSKNLGVEEKFGMSFGVLSVMGRTSKALGKAGASAVVYLQLEDPIGLSDVLNYLALSPGKDALEAAFEGRSSEPGMAAMGSMIRTGGVPTMVLSPAASQSVLDELGIEAAAFEAFVAGSDKKVEAKAEAKGKCQVEVKLDADARASNVVAVLRGSDPKLAEEAIVYSAHMDHVGKRMDGDVFNGADDNASGSAGLLAIASAYAKAKKPPRRSIIFLSVSGEELGLWGSRYYSEHPTWPLKQIVADINTDMIGRSGPESGPMEVTVTPSYRHRAFSTIVRDAARFGKTLGMTFSSGDKYYQRSDHYNFARKGVPVVFFCNGEHEDYHQVSDHSDKLDGDKMERIARLAFWTGWHVANADERPQDLGRQKGWQ